MKADVLLLVLVRLGLAVGEPRTADERLLEMVERELTDMTQEVPHHIKPGHKTHRSRHRVRHRPRGSLPPEAEIRCFCNLPACVTTGYMCQSMVGSCFSETIESERRTHTRHGCLELLSRHKQHICERLHSENKADLRLRCCTEDMCNVDGPLGSVDAAVQAAHRRNSSFVPVPTPPQELLNLSGGRQQQQQQQRTGELWLRAATIAVPIAGLFILAVLVLLAVRMLRRETKPQYQYAKAPLCLEAGCEPAGGVRLLASPEHAAVGAGAGAEAGAGAGVQPHRTAVRCVYAVEPHCPHAAGV